MFNRTIPRRLIASGASAIDYLKLIDYNDGVWMVPVFSQFKGENHGT